MLNCADIDITKKKRCNHMQKEDLRIKNKDKDLDVQSWFFALRTLAETKIYSKIIKNKTKK